jgi:FkbM family methyltransferase
MDLRTLAKTYLPAPVTDTLKMAKYNLDLWTFNKRVVSHRYGDLGLQMHIEDRVAKEWYDKDWDLPHEIRFLVSHGLKPGALVFDLGAHQCLIAMLLGKQVGPNGLVVAVEANEHNADVAERNLELNNVSNVSVIHALISSTIGTDRASASFNSSRDSSSIASEMVSTLTIDDMVHRLGVPNVIFMDIEGFEIEALRGARETLQKACTWFVELHGDEQLSRYGAVNADILRYFPREAYTAFLCEEDGTNFRELRGNPPKDRCFLVFVPAEQMRPQ